jgi:glyoxylase-like metal-dependent hydrolase (beta-lactamase superfamily II)
MTDTIGAMVWHWSIGDVEVMRIDSANFVLPSPDTLPAWAVPGFTASVDAYPAAFSALLIRAGSCTIIVDPWIVDDAPRSVPNATEVIDGLLGQLAELGVKAHEVDVVVNTHIDGIGWNTRPTDDGWRPTFPNARYLIPSDVLATIESGVPINGSEHLGPLHDAGAVDRIEPPSEVAPGVTLVAAPGHDRGHVAVRIERGGDLAVYAGHLVLSLVQIDDPGVDIGDADLVTAAATRRAILGELADRRGVLLTTLIGGSGGGVVEAQGDGFRLIATGD